MQILHHVLFYFQGSSRSVNMMEWDKIWSVNKKVNSS